MTTGKSTGKPTPRVRGGIARKKRAGGAALAGQLLGDADTAKQDSPSDEANAGSDVVRQSSSPQVGSPAESVAEKEEERPAEDTGVVRAISSAASAATGRAKPGEDHGPTAKMDADEAAAEPVEGDREGGAEAEPELVRSGAGSSTTTEVAPAPADGLTDTSERIAELLRPGAWSSPGEDTPQSGNAAPLPEQSTPEDEEEDEEPGNEQNLGDANDRLHVGVYLTRAARYALRRANRTTGVLLAVLAMNAIDHAIRSGTLRELIEIRHVEPRPPDSVFPPRQSRRRQPKKDGTSSSKVLQQLLMTEAEIKALADLRKPYGAENQSELLAAALEAIYDPEGVERLRSNAAQEWGPDQPPVQHLD